MEGAYMPGKTELQHQEMIMVLDFGSQYNQLITRRIREFGVYSELHPHSITMEEIKAINPSGIVLSGDPIAFMRKMLFVVTKGYLNWVYRYWEFAMGCSL